MIRLSRRTFVAAAGAAALAPAALAAPRRKQAGPLVLNDASRLNPTPVARNVMLRGEDDALIEQLRALLKDAAAEGRPVCIGGARHSMGGQSLMRDGFAASLGGRVEPDTARRIVRVSGGARWRDVIAALDPLGFSPAVTQSNHDFSVGGTLCVNAHGWAGAVRAVRRDGEALPADAGGRQRLSPARARRTRICSRSRSAATGCSGSCSMPNSRWPTTCCSLRGPR